MSPAGYGGPIGCDGVFSPFSNDRVVRMNNSSPRAVETAFVPGAVASGALFRGFKNNKAVNFQDIGDGSSNTFAIGEFSGGEYKGPTPADSFIPLRAGYAYGATTLPALANLSDQGRFNGFYIPQVVYQTRSVVGPINSRDPSLYVDANFNAQPLNSAHPGGANMARADGSVAFIDESISPENLLSLSGVDDGQIVTDF